MLIAMLSHYASIAIDSRLLQLPDGHQDADKGGGDDPERHRAPAVLAALAPAHGRDGLRRQRQALAGDGLQLLQHGYRAAREDRQARQQPAKLAGAGYRALNTTDRAEVALDPFAHDGIGGLPDVELRIEAARH